MHNIFLECETIYNNNNRRDIPFVPIEREMLRRARLFHRAPKHCNARVGVLLIIVRVKSPPPRKESNPLREAAYAQAKGQTSPRRGVVDGAYGLISHKFYGRHVVAPAIL